jgi:probable rRNA maturation factor
MMVVTVHIDRNQADAPDDESFRNWVISALNGDHAGSPIDDAAELSIQLVNSDQMIEFNARYRDQHTDTNVLSFPVDADLQHRTGLLGDLVLCDEVINREAAEQAKPSEHHWAHITIHGVLHLLGYDHIDESDAEIMEALEIQKLDGLAIPNPYNA